MPDRQHELALVSRIRWDNVSQMESESKAKSCTNFNRPRLRSAWSLRRNIFVRLDKAAIR